MEYILQLFSNGYSDMTLYEVLGNKLLSCVWVVGLVILMSKTNTSQRATSSTEALTR
ncbi:MAG: hypothetical protein AAF960_05785 [Bacteroidota bacterium]